MPRPGPLAASNFAFRLALFKIGEAFENAAQWWGTPVSIRGKERQSGRELTTLYFGTGQSLDHLMDKIYSDYTVSRRGRGAPLLMGRRWLETSDRAVDLVVGDLPWPYYKAFRGPKFVHIPALVVQQLALADSWEGVISSFRRNTRTTDLRKVRKWKLGYRLTTDVKDLADFYDTMYLPYAERRFGSLSVIDSREDVIASGRLGAVLQVMLDDRVVAAAVLVGRKETMHFFWLGILDNLDAPLADAAMSAIYFFSIEHAFKQKYSMLDMSYTAPLLSDGVYRYKRKWGAGVTDRRMIDELLVRPLNLGPAVTGFLTSQPAVTRVPGGLAGKALLTDTVVSAQAVANLVDRYVSPGMTSFKICCTGTIGADALMERCSDEVAVELIAIADAADPAAAFCAA